MSWINELWLAAGLYNGNIKFNWMSWLFITIQTKKINNNGNETIHEGKGGIEIKAIWNAAQPLINKTDL